MHRALPSVLAALAVVAAAVAVDLVLLGYVGNRNDPVGKLSPVAPGLTVPATVPAPAPPATSPPTTSGRHDEGRSSDD